MYQIPADVIQYLTAAPPTILLAPDAPVFTIIYANPAYLKATLTKPEHIVGLGFTVAFPESPEDPEGDNVYVLQNSLHECLNTKERVELPGKRYDIPIRGTDQFETKYWQASNNPVLNDKGEVEYIAHVTVEITGAYDLAKKERIAREVTEAKRRDLQSLLMEAPAAISILDGADLVFEFENAMHKNVFAKHSLIGRTYSEAFSNSDNAEQIERLKKVFSDGETYERREVMVKSSQTLQEQFWNFIYQPRYNPQNIIDGIVVFGYNVTDQVISRKRVEDSEKRLQTILETMAEGIGIVNKAGLIVYANPMAENLLGIRKEEIIQRSYSDPRWQNLRTDGTPLPEHEHPMHITMSSGQPVFDYEVGVQPPRGEKFYISINAAPLKDENGSVTGAIGTFMDVTQRRKSLQMKDEFISTVSHELKTPLTSIKAYLQMLNRSLTGTVNANNRRFLDRLDVQVNRLEDLIRDFLDVTRIDSEKLQLKASEFSMNQVVEELVNDLQLVMPTHQLIVNQNQPVKVVADRNRIIQVLTNLITNAVKYSPEADKVIIALQSSDDELICSVQDYGIGISDNQKSLVFERFHQAGNNNGSGLSLGLGLYISREIIEKAGGKIWLDSEPGKGSTFYFTLPLSE